MDRGTRLSGLFQSLEKINSQRSGPRHGGEDLQQLRYLTNKILQYVTSQEKVHRDTIMRTSCYLDQLMVTLEFTEDLCVEGNIVHIINELIGKTQTSKRASSLVHHGATQMLLSVLVYEAREAHPPEDLLLLIHTVLAKLAPKDRKFGVKARLGQALPVTLNLLKNFITNTKALQPVLHVLKLYAQNAVNASYLGKNGVVSQLFKVLGVCGRKHLTLLKYALDTLTQLVKSKSNSARAIGHGGVPILLNMFYDWHRVDSKNRHVNIRKAVLHVLKHITNLKSGRKALMEADGIRILYTTCQETIDCRELEPVIFNSSLIMRKCFPRNRIPLNSLRSPLTCDLPQSDFHVIETGEGQEGALLSLLGQSAGDDDDESSLDNDDDISSDDELDAQKEDLEDGDGSLSRDPPHRRTLDDLKMYEAFFTEQTDFQIPDEDELCEAPPQQVRSASALSTRPPPGQPITPNRHSLPNLPDHQLGSADHRLMPAFQTMRLSSRASNHDNNGAVSLSDLALRGMSATPPNSPRYSNGSSSDTSHASAVNLKTGCSVFTLDISSAKLNQRSPKGKRRGLKGSKKSIKSKQTQKIKTVERCEEWAVDSNSLCITPMLTSGNNNADYSYLDGEMDDPPEPGFVGPETLQSPEIYADIASRTRSVGRFNKLAYPDMHGHLPPPFREPLHEKKFGVQRAKIFEDIDRMIHSDQILDRVVYDLDDLVNRAGTMYKTEFSNHSNRDEHRISRDLEDDYLRFNSQFESGNLRKVIQVREYEYDLILNPDINTNHHHQWFYFEVSNMVAGIKYRFNIVNCEKVNSQFNFGMRPVMYSVTEAMQGRPHWVRAGKEICYYKNHYIRSQQTTGGVRGKSYYTATFTITFQHDRDVCYLAYHYPYTYSMLQTHLYKWENCYDASTIYYCNQKLTETIGGNPVPLLTITSQPQGQDRQSLQQFQNRPYIFLSSRVHPGESNASWVMKGTIDYLLSNKPSAQALRDMYIFKIVPMLNPDGVINGTHRCSLVAEDLNRRWMHPCPKLHPSIYHAKGLLQYLHATGRPPLVFCDYHGHSRRKNVFLYGCSPSLSWMMEDLDNPAISPNKIEDGGYKTLPRILHNTAPAFSWNNCSFMVEKAKEATARVVVWRQIGVVRSYTMESTYCGCDQGAYKGMHIGTKELEEMGRKFCEALARVRTRHIKVPSNTNIADQYRLDIPANPDDDVSRMDEPHMLEGATALDTASEIVDGDSLSSEEEEDGDSADEGMDEEEDQEDAEILD